MEIWIILKNEDKKEKKNVEEKDNLMEISLKKYVLIILQKYTKRKYKIQTQKEGDEFY